MNRIWKCLIPERMLTTNQIHEGHTGEVNINPVVCGMTCKHTLSFIEPNAQKPLVTGIPKCPSIIAR